MRVKRFQSQNQVQRRVILETWFGAGKLPVGDPSGAQTPFFFAQLMLLLFLMGAVLGWG